MQAVALALLLRFETQVVDAWVQRIRPSGSSSPTLSPVVPTLRIGPLHYSSATDEVNEAEVSRHAVNRFFQGTSVRFDSAATERTTRQEESSVPTKHATPKLSLPIKGLDGIYKVTSPAEHRALQLAFPDHIVVTKVYAPWCRACLSMAPKFISLAHSDKYVGLPLIFAEIAFPATNDDTKDYILQLLPKLSLPSVHLSNGTKSLEAFPCGPSKLALLKSKIAAAVNQHVSTTRLQHRATPDMPRSNDFVRLAMAP
jgi:thiol-disulfide isomerase/thioredoxin